ncbi:MAG: S41 family peptidase [Acidobacteriota bacterium]|nr:S41 family peptidase [Acidobacteriota bacterium]
MSLQAPGEEGSTAEQPRAGGGASARRPPASRGRLEVWGTRATALLLVVLLLLCGVWLGGHPRELPGFMREAFEANSQAEVTAEAINTVAQDYYRHVPRSQLADASISGLIASLNDPFSHYLDPAEYRRFAHPGTFSGVGMIAVGHPGGLLIERVFDASPAQRAGLEPGGLIVAVNGRSIAHMAEQDARNLIRGPAGTTVSITVTHGGAGRTYELTRAVVSEPVVASRGRVVDGVKLGVVYLAEFSEGAHAEVREAVERELHQGARGIALDLRSNGGGLVSEARLIASIFIPSGVVVSMRARTQPSAVVTVTGEAIPASIPMVVLVDRHTASAAEIVTAALQDHHRATVVGTHTFGKGVFQDLLGLQNGGALDLTVGEYFTPNGRNLGGGGVREGAGITPEVQIPPANVDTEAGLQRALEVLAAKLPATRAPARG